VEGFFFVQFNQLVSCINQCVLGICLNYITKKHILPEEKFTIAEILTVFSEIFFKKTKVEV
jgi:hypothetical protein